jgi:hypothetical protein
MIVWTTVAGYAVATGWMVVRVVMAINDSRVGAGAKKPHETENQVEADIWVMYEGSATAAAVWGMMVSLEARFSCNAAAARLTADMSARREGNRSLEIFILSIRYEFDVLKRVMDLVSYYRSPTASVYIL